MPSVLQLEHIEKHFKSGGGIAFERLPCEMSDALDALHRPWFEHLLVQQWFPAEPRIEKLLADGGSLLEVGCGSGRAAVAIARAYPQAHITGIDAHDGSIKAAQALAKSASLENVRFFCTNLEDFKRGSYDIVLVIDTVHDMLDPVKSLQDMNALLKSGGFIFWSEPSGSHDPRENRAPATRMRQNLSMYHCLTLSLAIGGAGLGTLIGEVGARKLAESAGFPSFKKLAIDSPVQQFFVLDHFTNS